MHPNAPCNLLVRLSNALMEVVVVSTLIAQHYLHAPFTHPFDVVMDLVKQELTRAHSLPVVPCFDVLVENAWKPEHSVLRMSHVLRLF